MVALESIHEPPMRRPWKNAGVAHVSDYISQDNIAALSSSILSPVEKARKKYIADYLNADSGSDHQIMNLTRNSMASSKTSQHGLPYNGTNPLIMKHLSNQKAVNYNNNNYLDSTVISGQSDRRATSNSRHLQ